MNKNVLSKLSKIESNVELSDVKVDLSLLTDIVAYSKGYDKYYSELQGLQQKGDRLKSELNDVISAIYKWGDLGNMMANDMASLLTQFEKQAKDLGIDPKSSKEYVDGEKKFKAYSESSNAVKRLSDAYSKIR